MLSSMRKTWQPRTSDSAKTVNFYQISTCCSTREWEAGLLSLLYSRFWAGRHSRVHMHGCARVVSQLC